MDVNKVTTENLNNQALVLQRQAQQSQFEDGLKEASDHIVGLYRKHGNKTHNSRYI